MSYTVRQLAQLAGVSVRTVHYYDHIGLLRPAQRSANGYRLYGEDAILPLQQIMFFREMDFSLDEIKKIMASFNVNTYEGMRNHAIFVVLLDTGLRIAECTGLSLPDVNFEGGFIKVMGKGSKERIVPIGSYARMVGEGLFAL